MIVRKFRYTENSVSVSYVIVVNRNKLTMCMLAFSVLVFERVCYGSWCRLSEPSHAAMFAMQGNDISCFSYHKGRVLHAV